MKLAILAMGVLILQGNILRADVVVQPTCPVMEGTPVDRSIFTEHQGKKVYFCCKLCRQTFIDSPEKYLPKLPQFAATDTENSNERSGASATDPHGAAEPRFSAHRLIKPLGIATYSCLLLTIGAGLFRRKLGKRFLGLHKPLAMLTFGLATTHAILVLILD